VAPVLPPGSTVTHTFSASSLMSTVHLLLMFSNILLTCYSTEGKTGQTGKILLFLNGHSLLYFKCSAAVLEAAVLEHKAHF